MERPKQLIRQRIEVDALVKCANHQLLTNFIHEYWTLMTGFDYDPEYFNSSTIKVSFQ